MNMIRQTTIPTNQRRIAIVKRPRPHQARLGMIRAGVLPLRDNTVAWATISDSTPDSSDNWLSTILMQQSQARLATPGTLTYTPASTTPAPAVAPWNSWAQPNCGDTGAAQIGVDNASPGAPSDSLFWKIVGASAIAASAVFITKTLFEQGRGR